MAVRRQPYARLGMPLGSPVVSPGKAAASGSVGGVSDDDAPVAGFAGGVDPAAGVPGGLTGDTLEDMGGTELGAAQQ